MSEERKHIIDEVNKERTRQLVKFGVQNHPPEIWLALLGEEVGEANKAFVEHKFSAAPILDYRTELIQVAAVAISMIECLDRNTIKELPNGRRSRK